MDNKLGQKRTKLNDLSEKYNPLNMGGKLMESFSPEFRELMEKLREVDDKIRSIAMGEDGSEEGKTLKDLLKVARTNFNRREFMTAIAFLGRFHDRLELIDQEIAKLENSVNMKHYEFLFGDIEPEHMEYLTKNLGSKFEKYQKTPTGILSTSNMERALIVKTSSIEDWWHNLTSDSERNKTLSAWEKRFPRYTKDLKHQTNNMLARSESLLGTLLSTFKEMSSLRNARKLEEYIKVSKKLQEKFKSYNMAFIQFYSSYVKKFIDYQRDTQQSMVELNKGTAKENMDKVVSPLLSPLSNKVTPDKDLPSFSRPEPSMIPSEPTMTSLERGKLPTLKKDEEPDTERMRYLPHFDPLPFPKPKSPLPIAKEPLQKTKDYPLPPIKFPTLDELEVPTPKVPVQMQPEAFEERLEIPPPPLMPNLNDTLPSAGVIHKRKADHTSFLSSLASLENEHPMILAKELISYANSLENIEDKNKLISIAQNILKG